ncbi:MAG: 30S ribosomal protein S2 [Candidatus Peregrinibacteria bacterium]
MSHFSLAELAEHAVHFGHKTTRWNPKMKSYLYGSEKGVHLFNLRKTAEGMEKLLKDITDLSKAGKTILFVSTKPQTKLLFEEFQQKTGYPIVVNKWIGGLLTNFETIRKRIKKMKDLKEMFETGEIDKYMKKEKGVMKKELEKLEESFGGISDLYRLPDAVFVVDGKRDKTAILEANRLKIPVIGIADSNVDPDDYTTFVPGNDDAISSLTYILSFVFEAAGKRGDDKKAKEEGAE